MLSRHYLLLPPHLIHLQDSLTDLQDSVTGLGTNGNMYPVLSVFFHAQAAPTQVWAVRPALKSAGKGGC